MKDVVTALEPDTDTSRPDGAAGGKRPLKTVIGDYVSLTKPRIIELLLITTFPVMFLAERGIPNAWLIIATLIGGTLSASSANVLNCYLDRDIDKLMHRTEGRPLVTGAISPRNALIFGIVLGVAATLWLGLLVNWLSSLLSLAAIALYVGFYTVLLKRRTSQNIVWGGVAGCMPVFIGWAAVTDSLSWAAVVLFLVVFFWTPPHYWPLSMRFKDDYANAGVPMLPVVAEDLAVGKQIVAYSWVTVLTSFALIPIAPMGWIYTAIAVISGGVFLFEAHMLLKRAKEGAPYSVLKPMRLFHYSISYLTLLFIGVALDPLWYFAVTG
ncbi:MULTISPECIES: heme o synthase [unclassified Dermacoccus]|uniref:Protoheme IX farnesyltransferase n=2 Tax=Dermacoccus TaxID=57495 RepID=A0ABX5Z929_9MICO|nr:protoheme IX farnesyltransferase [Dermacoccus sp. PE3]MBZ4496539.1 heme o synthase [Dermacoccus sp. Tok2021]QEH93291.1 protoheme IX farnesyltransferase [Dermacoccus abyssi]QNK52056.1 protoheme IX farnesyltransferase [Dermacoccus sp. PAMC28757]